ncbi:MAG TPA: Ig-like domain-containing protein [Syntrophomonadaceae bacterium]|nr:Ig-like domain-containing protein [Syntrophomonadaceae bacterium]
MKLGSFVQRKALWLAWLALFLFVFITPVSAATYTYDDLGRLISVTTTSGPSCTYTYDAGGNILSVTNQASLALVSSNPQNQALNIPVDQTIEIHFNKNIEQDVNFAVISLMAGQDSISIANSVYAETLIINPVSNLLQSTVYDLHVPVGAVKTASGTQSNSDITLQFTTVAPGLNMIASDPVNNATGVPVSKTITVTFSQEVQAGDNYANISLTCGGQTVAASNSLADSLLAVDPVGDLAENTSYTLTIPAGAVKNLSGALSNSDITVEFTTLASGLNMTASDPANNSTGVPVSQTITVTFNQNIQTGDNYAGISLTCGGQPVSTTNSIAGSVLTVDPASDLTGNTAYVLSIPTSALKNIDSSSSSSEINVQFTTV